MRTLVIQLARFGDIYQAWPTLKALRRLYPNQELHVLVRERFAKAMQGLDGIIVHTFDTAYFLDPIISRSDIQGASQALMGKVDQWSALNFDRVINLTFSPMSSYLTDMLSSHQTEVRGYTRFNDGFLNIPDDASAYFFAQGEIGGYNRYHITQIFAAVAGVDLIPSDFETIRAKRNSNQVVIHLGASQESRHYPGELWLKAITQISQYATCVLVGSQEEKGLANTITQSLASPKVIDRVGQTSFPELFQLLAESTVFVGADSAPAQVASLTQTPIVQLTSDTANFWTTGPTSPGSRVLYRDDLAQIAPEEIALHVKSLIDGDQPPGPCFLREQQIGDYQPYHCHVPDFSWRLIEALYTQANYPQTDDPLDLLGFQRLFELAELTLSELPDPSAVDQRTIHVGLLNQIDVMLKEVARLSPRIGPVIQWFETERIRIPPGTLKSTLTRTRELFDDLKSIASVYARYSHPDQEALRVVELCKKLAPSFREYETDQIQGEFQDLIATLHELSRHRSQLANQPWSTWLSRLSQAFEARDYVEIADQLEHELSPALSHDLSL